MMSKRGEAKVTSPIANWPWWQRGLVSFVVMVCAGGAFKYFEASQQAAVDERVDQIVAAKEAREARAQETEASVERGRQALSEADAAVSESERIKTLLVGSWESSGDVMQVEGGEVQSVSDKYQFTKSGEYYNWAIFDMTIYESPLFSGRYRWGEKGTYAIKGDQIHWSPSEITVKPVARSSHDRDKRQAMAVLAQQMSDDLDASDDEITIFNDDEFILGTRMNDGSLFSVRYQRSEEGL
ncbi:MAG: hypothetical protein AAGH57_10570 [Pseudomonadota bacterium]